MKKVHFIVFYKDELCVEKCISCINALRTPDDVETDILGVNEGTSVTEAYEAAMAESDADVKIYVRENIYITNPDFLECVIDFMNKHPEVGMAGIVGGFQRREEFVEWTCGAVNIFNEDRQTRFYIEKQNEFEYVDFLAGHILITQKDITWLSNDEKRDRYFDIVHSEKTGSEGYKLAVINFEEPAAIWEYGKTPYDRFDVYTDDIGAWAWIPKEEPLVSVVSVTHNSEKFVSPTIESVINQSYRNIQFVITDDFSEDGTVALLNRYAQNDSGMVILTSDRNRHACFAENNSYEHCKGNYLAMIGHDDVWRLWKLEEQISLLEHNKEVAACFSHCHVVDENLKICDEHSGVYKVFKRKNKTREEWIDQLFWNGNCLCAPSAVIRNSLIEHPLYKLGLLQVQDYDLWLRLLLKGDFYIMQDCLTLYRQFETGTNLSNLENENGLSPKYIRTLNETQLFKYQFIMSLSSTDLNQWFGKYLINKNFESKLEMMCEKAFLLYKEKNRHYIDVFNEIIDSQDGLFVLEKEYKTSLLDFYEMETQFMW